jgi:hypothetical protein
MFVQVKCRKKKMEIKKVFGQIFEYLLCTNVCCVDTGHGEMSHVPAWCWRTRRGVKKPNLVLKSSYVVKG